ncbi:MAG: hypothetical protein JW878_08245 [Methanomicrobia archaeon]|nr:hypothetical protein [Methanomicrobia archaeon]
MEEKKYGLRIPRGIATGIIFEAAERFGLEVDQDKPPEDAFDMTTGLPVKDYVPQTVLRGESTEILMAAQDYIYKRHEEWVEGVEEWRKMRREQIQRKIRKK